MLSYQRRIVLLKRPVLLLRLEGVFRFPVLALVRAHFKSDFAYVLWKLIAYKGKENVAR